MIAIGLMTLSIAIFAQRRQRDPQAFANRQADTMKQVLMLTDAQYATIKNINEKYVNKFSELRKDSLAGKDQKRNEARTLIQEKDRELSAVLTPDQQEKWKTHLAEVRAKGDANHDRLKERSADKLKTALSLTDDQSKKMEEENIAFMDKMRMLRSDSAQSKEDHSKQFSTLRTDHEVAIKNILTLDQFEKWKAYQAEMKSRAHKRSH